MVGEKASELRDATGERMSQMGKAIREGVVKADEAIQDSLEQRGKQPQRVAEAPRGI